MHGTVLVPKYPVATHVNVQLAPLVTSEAEQSVVYASFPDPPAAMLPVHGAAVTASQQTAAVVPVTLDPLFWVLAATVPSPPEQSTSVEESVFPVHLSVTVLTVLVQPLSV